MSYIDGHWEGDSLEPYSSPFFKYDISASLDPQNKEIVLSLLGKDGSITPRELRMPFVKGTAVTHVASFIKNKSVWFFFMQDKTKEGHGDIHIAVHLAKESVKEERGLTFLYMDINVRGFDGELALVGSLKIPEDTHAVYPSTQFHWRAS